MNADEIKDAVGAYYTEKLRAFGTTPRGVDWNSAESQHLRFRELVHLFAGSGPYSVIDYGCGYGALWDYLSQRSIRVSYQGFDISNEMIESARSSHPGSNARWLNDEEGLEPADYVVASGLFNVRLATPDAQWTEYILRTLDRFNQLSSVGFAFNVLTGYSDKDCMKDYLYYADPLYLFDHCVRSYSRWVSLIHDYPLYEFTILVRKKGAEQ